MNIEEIRCGNRLAFQLFRNSFSRKSSFLKKVHVHKSYEFPSRIRVAEASPKKYKAKQNGDVEEVFLKKERKRKVQLDKNLPTTEATIIEKRCPNRSRYLM